MAQYYSWSLNIGRWLGVPVRVHYCLVLAIATIFCVQSYHLPVSPDGIVSTALATTLVLVASVLLHELAHVFAVCNLGGTPRRLVLAPWGGVSEMQMPLSRQSQAIVSAAGPFANLAVAMCGIVLLVQSGKSPLSELIQPFMPHQFDSVHWEVTLAKIVTWVNFQMFLVNVIPVYPFDGYMVAKVVLRAKNRNATAVEVERAMLILAHITAALFIVGACFAGSWPVGPIGPVWFVLLVAGVTLFFASWHGYHLCVQQIDEERHFDALVAELDSDGFLSQLDRHFEQYDDFENGSPESFSQWLQEKQHLRESASPDPIGAPNSDDSDRRLVEEFEDELVDEILEKLHHDGFDGLTRDEKAVLHRVSERYRRRADTPPQR